MKKTKSKKTGNSKKTNAPVKKQIQKTTKNLKTETTKKADYSNTRVAQGILLYDIKVLYMHLSVVTGFESTLSNVLVSFIDITELKNNEEILSRSRKEWIETFDLIPDMITILDKQYRIVRANKAAIDKIGVSLHDAIGLHCYQCIHGNNEPHSLCPHELMLNDGKEHVADFHEEILGMDLLVSVTPIFDKNGNITGSVHIARDITERKKFENKLKEKNAELVELNATKDKFFNIIAHDMKNPL